MTKEKSVNIKKNEDSIPHSEFPENSLLKRIPSKVLFSETQLIGGKKIDEVHWPFSRIVEHERNVAKSPNFIFVIGLYKSRGHTNGKMSFQLLFIKRITLDCSNWNSLRIIVNTDINS